MCHSTYTLRQEYYIAIDMQNMVQTCIPALQMASLSLITMMSASSGPESLLALICWRQMNSAAVPLQDTAPTGGGTGAKLGQTRVVCGVQHECCRIRQRVQLPGCDVVLSYVYDTLYRMQCIADMAWVIDLRCSKQGGGTVKVHGIGHRV